MTINDILKIAGSPEKEDVVTELKSIRKLIPFDRHQQEDIACQIVAFANRHGGKIIFGINDDGSPDAKIQVDIDMINAKLYELCYSKISPAVDCVTEYFEDSEHQFFLVQIPKKKTIPHALVERSNGEITKRVYYIRTGHGKRLVTDSQLEWLFQNPGDPEFNHQFRIGLEFDREMFVVGEITTMGSYGYYHFRDVLAPEDRKIFEADNNKFTKWMNMIMPFLIIGSLQEYFRKSWHIGTTDEFDRFSSGPLYKKSVIDDYPIKICDIPVEDMPDLELKWNFNQILKDLYPEPMLFPAGTSVSIKYENEYWPSIYLRNKDFDIEITLGMLSGGAGLHQKSITHEILHARNPGNYHNDVRSRFLHYDGACYLKGKINYPNYGMEEFNDYQNYFNAIKTLLDYNWSFDLAREKYAPKEILILNDKVDVLLRLLKSKKD